MTTPYDKLTFVINTIKESGEFPAFVMGAIEKADESGVQFTAGFASLTSLELVTPTTWMGEKPDYQLHCNFGINFPPQTFQMDIEIFKGKSSLYLIEVQQKAFLIAIDSDASGGGAFVFNLSGMPKSWAILKQKLDITSGVSPEARDKSKMSFIIRHIIQRLERR